MKLFNYVLIASIIAALCACRQRSERSEAVNKNNTFFDKAGMDTTTKASQNFFLYANGTWIKNVKIPSSWGVWGSFWTLYDKNLNRLHQLEINACQKNSPAGSNEQQVGDMYISGMDTVTIDRLGYQPVKTLLFKVNDIKDVQGLLNMAADNYPDGYQLVFNCNVAPDAKISSKNVVHFDQVKLGLPGRDYYLKTDFNSNKLVLSYLKYIAKLFELTGTDEKNAMIKAKGIFELEKKIARSEYNATQLRDPVLNYHKFSVPDFQRLVPDIDLADIFKHLQIKTDSVIIGQPAFYRAIDSLLKSVPLDTWKNKATFDVLNKAAPLLSKDFRIAEFNFYGKQLDGEQSPGERWKTVTSLIDKKLSDPLGRMYADNYFTAADKKRVLSMVRNIQDAFKERISKLTWMSPQTKIRALEKLAAIAIKIGYPDKWDNYQDVIVNKKTYYANYLAIARHDYKKGISKINKPVDKAQWVLTVPTVDAFYTPVLNDIDFPAGFLQPPFFNRDADDAINYGAVGSIIGHELTHGFDDQGRQFDKAGKLKDWWLLQDAVQFKKRVKVIIDQYDAFTVLNGIHVNGSLSQGEAIADHGGLQIAYDAFKKTQQGRGNKILDGFTPDQRFFLGFAQQWRIKRSDEVMRQRIITDPHAPEMYRVDGTVSNITAFYKAFNIKPGDLMYHPDSLRVDIW